MDTGRVEIGNHTYDMHKQASRRGAMKKRGESNEAYKETLSADLMKTQLLLEQHCGVVPQVFAYPFGAISNASLDVIKELGFEMSLGCREKVNNITRGEDVYKRQIYAMLFQKRLHFCVGGRTDVEGRVSCKKRRRLINSDLF